MIEKKYGRPAGEWLDLVRSSALEKHANALVAHVRANG